MNDHSADSIIQSFKSKISLNEILNSVKSSELKFSQSEAFDEND